MRYVVLSSLIILSGCSGEKDKEACEKQLYEFGLVFKRYAYFKGNDDWPALDHTKKRLTPMWKDIYPEFLENPSFMICPADHIPPELNEPSDIAAETLIDSHSYWYVGYRLFDEETALKFLAAYRQGIESGNKFTDDIRIDNETVIERFRETIDHGMVADINDLIPPTNQQSSYPAMIERPENHGNGGHVLFMDGHVKFIPYPGKYPMTEKVIEALRALDKLDETQ